MDRPVFIGLIGPTKSGKTSLMNSMTNAGLSNSHFETIGANFRNFQKDGVRITFADIGGRIDMIAKEAINNLFKTLIICLFVYDVSQDINLDWTTRQIERLLMEQGELKKLIFIGNKSDLKIDSGTELRILSLIKKYGTDIPVDHYYTSDTDLVSVIRLRERLLKFIKTEASDTL